MAVPIIPRLVRGRLYFEIGPALFPTFAQAAGAWSATESHRLDIAESLEALVAQRAVALVEMRIAGDDLLRFRSASKREATLAAEIRRLRRSPCAESGHCWVGTGDDRVVCDDCGVAS